MDFWDILSLMWVPCLVLGIAFQIRAIYLRQVMVKRYGFNFPQRLFKPVHLGELRTNYQMTDSDSLKKVIAKFIFSKKCFYFFIITAVLIVVVPILFKLWVTSGNKYKT